MKPVGETLDGNLLVEVPHAEWLSLQHSHEFSTTVVNVNQLSFTESRTFYSWLRLQGFTEHHVKHMVSYYDHHLKDKSFGSPIEMATMLGEVSGKCNVVKAARLYFNYCEEYDLLPVHILTRYRKILKLKKKMPDTYVPSDDEIKDTYEKIRTHKALCLVFLVLLCSGVRLSAGMRFLATYEDSRFVKHAGFVHYAVGERHGKKATTNIYLPDFVHDQLENVYNTENALRVRMREKGSAFPLKALRKWFYNFARINGIDRDTVNWIQGRIGSDVDTLHYCDNERLATLAYAKIAEALKQFFSIREQ